MLQQLMAAENIDYALFEHVKNSHNSSYIKILDRNNIIVDEVRVDFSKNQGKWLKLEQISPALILAVIQSEDKNFYTHSGVDWLAIGSAVWTNITNNSGRGASTISMQLVGLLDNSLSPAGKRNYMDKFTQAKAALDLENNWTKAEILEAYLNLAPFKGEIIGVDAVSRAVFKKNASGLDLRESSVIAAMLRAPNASVIKVTNSACGILIKLGQAKYCHNLSDFIQLRYKEIDSTWSNEGKIASHFSRLVLQKIRQSNKSLNTDNSAIKTSLDASLQRFVIRSVHQHLSLLLQANVTDAAVVVLHNKTGQVLAYLGSSGSMSMASNVDHARALRQAGSTLKPFLYAKAIDKKYITAASLIDNSKLNLATASGIYVPKNYDQRFTGWVSTRTALAASLNIPAVKTLTMVGTTVFATTLVKLGLELDKTGDFYGYSLALGSADVSLLSLTNAYRALANLGIYSDYQYFQNETTNQEQILGSPASWITGDILSDRQSRVSTFGFDSPLSTSFWSASKTGTSKDMRDNWTIGFSEKYTVGVWVGNSTGASMHDVSGVSGAGPIWHDVMDFLHKHVSSKKPVKPVDVNQIEVEFAQKIEPDRHEFFIVGTETAKISLSSHKPVKIITPVSATYIALDPDIPLSKQKVLLQAQGQFNQDYKWFAGDKLIAGGQTAFWIPSVGEHIIRLIVNGKEVDKVKVYVKGLLMNFNSIISNN